MSRAVRGFPRTPPVRQVLAAGLLAVAVVLVAPSWWGDVALSAARWVGRFWLVAVLVVSAVAVWGTGRRRRVRMTVGRRPRPPAMPFLVHVVLLLVAASAVATVAGVLLWHVLGQPVVGAGPDQQTTPGAPVATAWSARDALDAVKIVLTLVGGVGAVVALTAAYRRQRLSEVEAYREETRTLLDRFCKAAELLGARDVSVRTAGVYAFAALANDAPESRQGSIDVLCAYLRQPWNPPPEAPGPVPDPQDRERGPLTTYPAEAPGDLRQERQLRHTVIRLVRDNLHLPDDDPRTWRGHDFDFSGMVLDGGDFRGATFTGDGTVTFADATITGPLSFDGATFSGGTVSFDGARFAGGSVSFAGATFSGGLVDLSRIDQTQRPPASKLWPAGVRVPAGLRLPPPATRDA
ncbi:pentapeptide repeat-containing protein [Micromonospora sp. NPDC023633]|uniref:pentapeptide repeat-containing protein n=1 Tax=Micromonospora sp. NPDC023633 TaxID=3154320 RepID=UPI0033E38448